MNTSSIEHSSNQAFCFCSGQSRFLFRILRKQSWKMSVLHRTTITTERIRAVPVKSFTLFPFNSTSTSGSAKFGGFDILCPIAGSAKLILLANFSQSNLDCWVARVRDFDSKIYRLFPPQETNTVHWLIYLVFSIVSTRRPWKLVIFAAKKYDYVEKNEIEAAQSDGEIVPFVVLRNDLIRLVDALWDWTHIGHITHTL